MLAAADHANDVVEGWSDLAFVFLRRFAALRVGIFTAEDVTRASVEYDLIQPPTTRAWGSVYLRAMKEGIIEHVDNEGRRANGSPCARYRRFS